MSKATDAISLEGVSLSYLSSAPGPSTIKQHVLHVGSHRGNGFERRWALNEVDLTVGRGEILGLIGHNGSGKSTLLRIIAGVLPPTRGRVIVRGRTTPILDLGTGVHHDASGRETIIFFGALLGRDPRVMAERAPAIAEWAGLSNYLDRPVRSYSAGMVARLCFAAVTDATEEILLIDEVLGVGDATFQRKCMDRIHQRAASGSTVVIASHDLAMLETHADRLVGLDSGAVAAIGDPAAVIAEAVKRHVAAQIP